MEDIRGEFKAVIEVVESSRETLGARIDTLETELRQEITDTKTGLKRLDLKLDSAEKNLRGEMLAMKYSLEAQILMTKQDLRAAMVELKQDLRQDSTAKFQKIETRLDQHETDIEILKKAQ